MGDVGAPIGGAGMYGGMWCACVAGIWCSREFSVTFVEETSRSLR